MFQLAFGKAVAPAIVLTGKESDYLWVGCVTLGAKIRDLDMHLSLLVVVEKQNASGRVFGSCPNVSWHTDVTSQGFYRDQFFDGISKGKPLLATRRGYQPVLYSALGRILRGYSRSLLLAYRCVLLSKDCLH